MNDQERLFLAIGGADMELVARSERGGRKSRYLPWGLAAAACLTLVLALGRVAPLRAETPIGPPEPAGPDLHETQGPNGGQLRLPERGDEVGTIRLLRYTPQSRGSSVDFLIYVNEERFCVTEEDGVYRIRNIHPLPEDFPECGMEIVHLSDTAPGQARLEAEDALREQYAEISREEPAAALPGSLYLRAGESPEQCGGEEELWRARQVELWFAGDGQGGTFVLASRYFLEAEEGLGASFRDMASSFRVVDLNEAVPDWMRELYETADRLFPALFANDLSGISDLLAEGADADAYGENVWPDVSIVSVDYAPDDSRNPTRATVSVKHRLNRVEGDSFCFLTMELIRRDGAWYLSWSGIEK